MKMTDRKEVSLTENGYGSTLYLGRDLLEDTGCPLDRGGNAIAELIPHVGILLIDVDDDADYEVIQDGRD